MPDAKPLKAGSTGAEQFTTSDTVPAVNLPVMVGDSGSGGTKGAVPAPAAGDAAAGKFLKADGTWATAGGGSSPNVISPAQITADQDNYNPSGWADATVVRLNLSADGWAITGFDPETDGEEKTLLNVTGRYAYIPSEHPDSTAAWRVVGESDHILEPFGSIRIVYDNTSSRWRITYNTFNPAAVWLTGKGLYFFQMPGSTNQSDHPFLGLSMSGTGADNQNDVPTTALPAAWGILTGSTATGVATMYLIKNALATTAFGSAHLAAWAWVYIPTLSTSAQRFTTQLSITASANGTTLAVNNSVGIRHSDNVNSGKWEVFSRDNAGTESTADSGITVAANTLYMLRIFVDKGRTEARFSITDGTNSYVGRIAANLPNAVTCGARLINSKSVGTTSRTLNCAGIGHYAIY